MPHEFDSNRIGNPMPYNIRVMREFYNLHPYFAFIPKSGVVVRDRLSQERIHRLRSPQSDRVPAGWLDVTANNHGFFCRHDYPFVPQRSDDTFILGVFGGSVANWFTLLEEEALVARLQALAQLRGRRAIVLNFASSGFKQPQSFFCLEYFCSLPQKLDAVLLIDGFNEAALSWKNWQGGVDHTFPHIVLMQMFPDIPCVANVSLDASSVTREKIGHQIADYWARMSIRMSRSCENQHIPFVHLLQPNQYYSRREFSPEEREFALSETTPYREPVKAIYPLMVKAIPAIRAAGANCHDGSTLFDGVREPVYSDNCCHYNQLGNDLLRDCVIPLLEQAL